MSSEELKNISQLRELRAQKNGSHIKRKEVTLISHFSRILFM